MLNSPRAPDLPASPGPRDDGNGYLATTTVCAPLNCTQCCLWNPPYLLLPSFLLLHPSGHSRSAAFVAYSKIRHDFDRTKRPSEINVAPSPPNPASPPRPPLPASPPSPTPPRPGSAKKISARTGSLGSLPTVAPVPSPTTVRPVVTGEDELEVRYSAGGVFPCVTIFGLRNTHSFSECGVRGFEPSLPWKTVLARLTCVNPVFSHFAPFGRRRQCSSPVPDV
jgi:hypothetical protein